MREVRLFLLGKGRQGKTSLARALRDPSGLAKHIDEADRTVALDVFRGWQPGPPDSDVLVSWGMAGAGGQEGAEVCAGECRHMLLTYAAEPGRDRQTDRQTDTETAIDSDRDIAREMYK